MEDIDVPTISPSDVFAQLASGVGLLDVREPDEYAEGHAPGATLIPLGELPGRTGEIPSGRPLYVICQSGRRSGLACQALRQAGVDAWNVEGGTAAWIELGLPCETGM